MSRQLNRPVPDGVKREWYYCTKCHRCLPRNSEYFSISRSRKDGMGSECRECANARRKAERTRDIISDAGNDIVRACLYWYAYHLHGGEHLRRRFEDAADRAYICVGFDATRR